MTDSEQTDPEQCIICLDALPRAAPAAVTSPTNPATTNHEKEAPAQEQGSGHLQASKLPPSGNGIIVPIFHKYGAEQPVVATDPTSAEADVDTDSTHVAKLHGCNHVLHESCIRSWAQKTNTCPICRTPFITVSVFDGIGGPLANEYAVEEKKQVADFDLREWLDQNDGLFDEEEEAPCPVCNTSDHEERLLLCDNCNAAYHTYCIGLEEIPEGHWYCMECTHSMAMPSHAGAAAANEDEAELDDLDPDSEVTSSPSTTTPTATTPIPPSATPSSRLFPRTRSRMRHARQQARTLDWQGPWGAITGRVFDGLDIDLDNPFGEDETMHHFRRSQQRSDRERREYERWQQRLNIARRLGAAEQFARNMPRGLSERIHDAPRERTPEQSREDPTERRAWGAFERAREQAIAQSAQSAQSDPSNARKRARSRTQSPNEHLEQEPERKLKRPRTRRLPAHGQGQSQGQGLAQAQAQAQAQTQAHGQGHVQGQADPSIPRRLSTSAASPVLPPPTLAEEPTFLSSLLREVEMSTPAEDDGFRYFHSTRALPPYPLYPDAPSPNSPLLSGHNSPRAMTPPPFSIGRPSSPPLSLSSHIEPRYPPANYSPTRRGSDGDSRRPTSPVRCDSVRATSPVVLVREPRPHRRASVREPPRMADASPTRQSQLTLETKSSISNMVRSALRPHWHANELTPDQYATINRDVSRKLYDVADDMADQEARKKWERLAAQEVARAIAELSQ